MLYFHAQSQSTFSFNSHYVKTLYHVLVLPELQAYATRSGCPSRSHTRPPPREYIHQQNHSARTRETMSLANINHKLRLVFHLVSIGRHTPTSSLTLHAYSSTVVHFFPSCLPSCLFFLSPLSAALDFAKSKSKIQSSITMNGVRDVRVSHFPSKPFHTQNTAAREMICITLDPGKVFVPLLIISRDSAGDKAVYFMVR